MSAFSDIQVGDEMMVWDGCLRRRVVIRVTQTRFSTQDGTSFLKSCGRAIGAGSGATHYAFRVTPELEAELRQQEYDARRWQLIPEIYARLVNLPLETLEATWEFIKLVGGDHNAQAVIEVWRRCAGEQIHE